MFEIEWEARYVDMYKRWCCIQTKEKIYGADQFKVKRPGELRKGAKVQNVVLVSKIQSTLAMHIVLAHNAMVRGHITKDGLKQIVQEHIELKIGSLRKSMLFYLGIPDESEE